MTNFPHIHPDQCIPLLGFQYCDGGREDYFSASYSRERPYDIQDCAVVAVSIAAYLNPQYKSPALSYREALADLIRSNRRIAPWKRKNYRETKLEFFQRRLREVIDERRSKPIPRHMDPLHGTHTDTISMALFRRRFRVVFAQPDQIEPVCLCSYYGTFVVDGMLRGSRDHAFTVIDGSIIADYDFRLLYDDFQVMHIWYKS